MFRFRPLLARGRAEVVAAVVFAVLAVVTVVNAEWIELVFGVDPDGGDGSLEWIVVMAAAAAAVACALDARRQWASVAAQPRRDP